MNINFFKIIYRIEYRNQEEFDLHIYGKNKHTKKIYREFYKYKENHYD